MGGYLVRRAGRCLLILFWVSLGSFTLSALLPGDYFTDARIDPVISQSSVAALRAERGLDRPLVSRYVRWLAAVSLHGDWGTSIAYNVPIGPLLWGRVRNTILLTLTAMIFAWLIGVPIGVWLAATGNVRIRTLGRGSLCLLLAAPELLVVLALQFLALRSGFLPIGGMSSMGAGQTNIWDVARDLARHLALPATALVIAALPVLIVHACASMNDALSAPFIRGARANGIPSARLLYRHALPAAAHPLISLFGLSVGALLSGSVLVENAMGWPGIGRLMLEATLERDANVVIAIVTLSAACLVAGNFLSDLLLYASRSEDSP